MRSSHVLRLLAAAAFVAACGDDGGNGPDNQAPTANFAAPTCDLLVCTFTDASTDADGSIASRVWEFESGTPATSTQASPVVTFAADGTWTVELTVTDNEGATNTFSREVTVAGTPNTDPTANFTFACNDLQCTFTDQSSDTDGTIASRSWNFGDTQTSTQQNPGHTYAAAGTFDVTLTVTDNRGGTANVTKQVTVTAPQAGGPTAAFEVTCAAATCTIDNTSTVPAGGTVTWAWDFGNGATSTDQDPAPVQYTVNDVTQFTISLTVTRDGVSSTATRQVSVSPAATLTCGDAACTLLLEEASTVVVTLESSDCEAQGNTFVLTAPIEEILFEDGCFAPTAPDPAASFNLNGGNAFAAGTELAAEVRSGLPGAQSPTLRVTGNFTDGWTLEFDDGFVGPNEPDFNDLIITVRATPVP